HCISQWGHDFRPEYRALRRLREEFPEVALHAYTATATQKVRHDIVQQLGLSKPEILVGSFDRPNLHYSVVRSGKKKEKLLHLCHLIERHKGESGIVYCISRKNVEELAKTLNDNGYRAIPYHAGLEDEPRKRAQEQFLNEEVDIIVATVAFGMGIDKTNVRYVAHWGMPKSVEHYQQESGRAGRDSLDSDCLLFHSAGDIVTWKRILSDLEPEHQKIAFSQLEEMESYANTTRCRHRFLVEYFGQAFEKEGCEACDLCLGGVETHPDSLVISQKILSCVIRLREMFGVKHTIEVLRGSKSAKVIRFSHHELSTYGLLQKESASDVGDWIAQLCDQGFLGRENERQTLFVTEEGRRVLKGERTPKLVKFETLPVEAFFDDSWEGVDMNLFKILKELRTRLAAEEQVPPYIVFGDAALRDMGRKRPSTHRSFLMVEGVGKKKCEKYGDLFLESINDYCRKNGLEMDIFNGARRSPIKLKPSMTEAKEEAFKLFKEGRDVETVAKQIERAPTTTQGYLAEYIDSHGVTDPSPWVDPDLHHRIGQAIEKVGGERLRPIFEELGEEVPYDQIRVSATCWKNQMPRD
ncbi:MAG: RecQ family ATP-dependent DNA helicase, partial [Candidatus Omnitrophica bacterium]|nr:RecQ family ATP-dependent DNA helicase [Candidatus Omnitrophota bacterium]